MDSQAVVIESRLVLSLDITELPAPAQKVLSPGGPAPLKLLAAKGVLPGLGPGDVLTVVVGLSKSEDEKISSAAAATLDALPPPLLEGALRADLPALVIDVLAQKLGRQEDVLLRLLSMRRIDAETLLSLASRADEKMGELIAINEALLLKHPGVIEKLYMNKAVRMSTADRLIHLAVRNGLELNLAAFKEAAEAIQGQLIPEPTEEPSLGDELFRETQELSEKLAGDLSKEDVCEPNEEGQEVVKPKFVPIFSKIAQMSVTEKIRTAMLGSSTERMLLIRDTNRLVSEAAVKSPRMTEAEAVLVAASRAVSEDVLRLVAMNRDFTKNYQVKFNLVSNPRTPFTFASRLIPHLREGEIRLLARSKNVPGAISTAARQQLLRKQK